VDFLLWKSDESFDVVMGNYGIIGSRRYPIRVPPEVKEKNRLLKARFDSNLNIY